MIKAQTVNYFKEKGIRDNNEDSISSSTTASGDSFFIVCDGMGGHSHGEIASQTVTESLNIFFSELSEPIIKYYIQEGINYVTDQLSNKDIYIDDNPKMGTTVVLAVLTESSILVGHAGDSRLYHIRSNEGLMFRTKDHSQVQEWIDAEIISDVEAREHPKKNIITRSIHPHPLKPIRIEINELKNVQTGDYLFLCTDGVMDAMKDEDIVKIISNDNITDKEKINYIKNQCSLNSKDNYSGFLLKIETDLAVVTEQKNEPVLETTKCPVCKNSLDIGAKYCAICGTEIHSDKFQEYADYGGKVTSYNFKTNISNSHLFNSKIDRQVYKFWNKHYYLILCIGFFCAIIAGKAIVIIHRIQSIIK